MWKRNQSQRQFCPAICSSKKQKLNLPLKIIHPKSNYEYNLKQKFIDSQIAQAEKQFKQIGLDFEVIEKTPDEIIKNLNPALIILDLNPILKRKYLKNADFKIYEIDGHNEVHPLKWTIVVGKKDFSGFNIERRIKCENKNNLLKNKNYNY